MVPAWSFFFLFCFFLSLSFFFFSVYPPFFFAFLSFFSFLFSPALSCLPKHSFSQGLARFFDGLRAGQLGAQLHQLLHTPQLVTGHRHHAQRPIANHTHLQENNNVHSLKTETAFWRDNKWSCTKIHSCLRADKIIDLTKEGKFVARDYRRRRKVYFWTECFEKQCIVCKQSLSISQIRYR